MAKLKEDIKNQNAIKIAGDIIGNIESLKAQQTEAEKSLTAVKAKIKKEVAAGNFSETDFTIFLQSAQRLTGIHLKFTSLKPQMKEIKKSLLDGQHKKDFQIEIDKI